MKFIRINLVFAIALSTGVQAAELPGEVPTTIPLQRFTVAKGGDILRVPVRINGKDRQFIVDTGSALSAFDPSLLHGKRRGMVHIETPGGVVDEDLYDAPPASVGHLPFRTGRPVWALDMKQIREAAGCPVDGFLGLDFLGKYVLRIDFDKGELLFLEAVPTNAGEEIPFTLEANGTPSVLVNFKDGDKVPFVIDTGWAGLGSGTLEILKARTLTRKGELRWLASAGGCVTAAGESTDHVYQGERIGLGGFSVAGPVFTEALLMSNLGLGFWSRFMVTIDFPKRRLFLRRGDNYDRPDHWFWNASGLILLMKGETVVIETVDARSSGEKAGIRAGDVLLELDGLRIREASLFALSISSVQGGATERHCAARRSGAPLHDHSGQVVYVRRVALHEWVQSDGPRVTNAFFS